MNKSNSTNKIAASAKLRGMQMYSQRFGANKNLRQSLDGATQGGKDLSPVQLASTGQMFDISNE